MRMKIVVLFLTAAFVLMAATEDRSRANSSGFLVDSGCYDSMERNVGQFDRTNRDKAEEVLSCVPTQKTKSFTIVRQDGIGYQLDSEGNRMAADLVREAGKKTRYFVFANGKVVRGTLSVDSIERVP